MRLLDELRRRWWLGLLVVAVVVLLFSSRAATFYTDVLWYSSVGYSDVFTTVLAARVGIGLAAAAIVAVLVGGNLLLARRLAPAFRLASAQEEGIERYRDALEPFARPVLLGVSLLVAALSGLSVNGEWSTLQLWANATEFGRADPVFDLDLGFFVFRLPFYLQLVSWLFSTLAFAILLTVAVHYVFGGLRPQSPGRKVTPQATVHLSVLLAALVAVRAWGFWLDRYQLSYSTRGVVTGLSYTDANAQLPALQLLTGIAAVCVVLFLLNLRFRSFLLPSAGVGILLVAAIVLGGIYPAAIQRFQVEPQELSRERPYIADNLELTRFGFGLDLESEVETEEFPAQAVLSVQEIERDAATLESVRLWDPTVLESVYFQLQGLRQYFEFPDVDIDRYDIDGVQRQTNIAVRELAEDNLPSASWQNQHLVYTHGYGIVSSDVSRKTPQGGPEFLAQDIPVTGLSELEVDEPRIYFGESSPDYSVVDTQEPELDYVSDEQATSYDGEDGVGIGSPLRRLAFALRFAEPNLVLSGLLNGESRVLYNRTVEERVRAAAPFLQFDSDPYPVASDGGIQWIVDGYTISDMVPYSTRVDLGDLTLTEQTRLQARQQPDGSLGLEEVQVREPGLVGPANYIRNSVKAVVDAYDGTITLYVIDDEDPVIAAWERVFPGALTPVEEASVELQEHFRYPEDLFRVQAQLFTRYHIEDADGFYTGDDNWRIPDDAAQIQNLPESERPPEGQEPPLRPYYLQTRLPGEQEQEFALIQPMNAAQRPNLTAWLAARSDPGVYGELKSYLMPDSSSVDGTEQVQANINTDRTIAQEITLLSRAGSRVRYGNLLTIPVGDSLMYAQPLFVISDQVEIPQLRQVVLVLGEQVVMEPTLEEALGALFGEAAPADEPIGGAPQDGAPGSSTPDPGGDVDGELDPEVADLIQQALDAFDEAQSALVEGDLGAYQEATDRAEDLLRQAQEVSGEAPADDLPAGGASGDPAAQPSASPTAP